MRFEFPQIFIFPPAGAWIILLINLVFTVVPLQVAVQSLSESASRARRSEERYRLIASVMSDYAFSIEYWINPPITITQLSNLIGGYGLKRDYVDYQHISVHAKLAVIASEDQVFAEHNGFDFISIEKAIKHNEKHPNRVRGASTISQQVAKNVFLWQGRSWFRKGLEVYFTFMIELFWSKERILEMYLNVAEMGKGIFGFEAASRSYFKKSAQKLTRTEAAMIAACLPNPKKYVVQPPSRYITRRYPWILNQMNNLEGDEDVEKLLEVPKPVRRKSK